MNNRTRNRILAGTAAGAAVIAGGLGALFAFTPRGNLPPAIPGRPLLQQDEDVFTDRQVGIQFTPPGNWSMQTRSTASPHEHTSERTVVKFKRLIPGFQVAWLKVSVADVAGDESPAALLQKRKPPESDWHVAKPVEDGLKVGGLPAARVTFAGPFDPDHQGERDFSCEMTAVRRGPNVFYLAGTFVTADPKGQERIHTAIDTVVFDPERLREFAMMGPPNRKDLRAIIRNAKNQKTVGDPSPRASLLGKSWMPFLVGVRLVVRDRPSPAEGKRLRGRD